MEEIACIILGNQHYSPDGQKVNFTLAVTFDDEVNLSNVRLKLTGENPLLIYIAGEIKDFDKPAGSQKGRYVHFHLNNLNCNAVYSYQIVDRNNHPYPIKEALGEEDEHDHRATTIKTPPALNDATQSVKFALGADQEVLEIFGSHGILEDNREATRAIYQEIAKPVNGYDFFMHLSDVFYGEGVIPHRQIKKYDDFRKHVEDDFNDIVRDSLGHLPAFRVLDDHDLGKNGVNHGIYQDNPEPFNNAIGLFNAFWPVPGANSTNRGLYYKVSRGDMDIWFLHNRIFSSNDMNDPHRLLGQTQYQWLQQSLATSTAKIRFIVSPLPFVMGKNSEEDFRGSPVEWNDLIHLFAFHNVSAIFCADSHNYSRTELKIGDKIIPQFIVGTFGGYGQKPVDAELDRIPAVTIPNTSTLNIGRAPGTTIDANGSEVKAYYTPASFLNFFTSKTKAYKEGRWREEEKRRYGYMSVEIERTQPPKLNTNFFLMKKKNDRFEPKIWDASSYNINQ
jgi:hypothetical protein